MGSERLEKFRKSAGRITKFMKFFEVLALIGVIAAVLLSISFAAGGVPDVSISLLGAERQLDTDSKALSVLLLLATAAYYAGIFLVCRFIDVTFKQMALGESPFNEGSCRRLKICSVLVTVLVVLKSDLVVGILVAVVLFCLMRLYGYGCELQKLSDETL